VRKLSTVIEWDLIWLVVWNMALMTFHILGIIIATDELIVFRGVGIPPTSNGMFINPTPKG
jgi:hypothetical protein